MDKITIKNICNATIALYVPDAKVSRELPAGRAFNIDKETYEILTFDQGFNNLVNLHYLQVIGLEDEERVSEDEVITTKEQIDKMLDTLDITAFAKFIPNAAPAEKETVIDLAVEKKITHSGFVTLIKKYCGRDIMELIHTKHQEED
jgi:hypothetical protein